MNYLAISWNEIFGQDFKILFQFRSKLESNSLMFTTDLMNVWYSLKRIDLKVGVCSSTLGSELSCVCQPCQIQMCTQELGFLTAYFSWNVTTQIGGFYPGLRIEIPQHILWKCLSFTAVLYWYYVSLSKQINSNEVTPYLKLVSVQV